MNKIQFIEKLKGISEVYSVTGKHYHSIQVTNNEVSFIRSHKEETEKISLDELFEFYKKEKNNVINTSIAKKYITNRAQSPAVAIIKKIIN